MDDRNTNNGATTGNTNNNNNNNQNNNNNAPNQRTNWVTTHFFWGEIPSPLGVPPPTAGDNNTQAHVHIAVDLDADIMPGFAPHKQRASERAIRKLKQVDFDSLPADATCSICLDCYDDPRKLEQQDPPVSVPGEAHIQTGHDDDPPESVPEHMDTDDADPAESVPDNHSESAGGTSTAETPAADAAAATDDGDGLPEQADDHRPLEMPCGHIFGARCLNEWLHESCTCPMCRTAVETQNDYLRESGQGTPPVDLSSLFRPFFSAFANAIRRPPGGGGTDSTSNTPQPPPDNTGDDDPPESAPTDQATREPPQPAPPLQGNYAGGGFGFRPFGRTFVVVNGQPFHAFWTQPSSRNGRPTTDQQQREAQTAEARWRQANETTQNRPQTPNNREQTFVSNTAINDALSALQEGANRVRDQANQPIGSSSSTSTEFARPVPASTQRPYRETARSNREARHHPYGQRSSAATSETVLVSDSDAMGELAAHPSVQCASMPMALCVGSSAAPDMVRLGCGHGYHEPCLRMAMRAHGDNEIPNLSTTPQSGQDGSVREVWCHVCRRYRQVVH